MGLFLTQVPSLPGLALARTANEGNRLSFMMSSVAAMSG